MISFSNRQELTETKIKSKNCESFEENKTNKIAGKRSVIKTNEKNTLISISNISGIIILYLNLLNYK